MNLKDIRTAIKASKRISGKAPVPLLNYQGALFLLKQWQFKLKLAQTKVKKYQKQVKRYEKKYGRGNDGPSKNDVNNPKQLDV